jgi:maltose O-acetyltransferase
MRMSGFPIHKKCCLWAGANLRSRKFRAGSGVFVNIGFYHDGFEFLTIGDRVRIGPYVKMITATHEMGSSHQRGLTEVVGKPITIEDGCWIGANVTVMPGVTVAAGCVLAAGSILHESTNRDGLYAGSPARRVRDLDF